MRLLNVQLPKNSVGLRPVPQIQVEVAELMPAIPAPPTGRHGAEAGGHVSKRGNPFWRRVLLDELKNLAGAAITHGPGLLVSVKSVDGEAMCERPRLAVLGGAQPKLPV